MSDPLYAPYAWSIDIDYVRGNGYGSRAGSAGPEFHSAKSRDRLLADFDLHQQFRMYRGQNGEGVCVAGTLFWNGDAEAPGTGQRNYAAFPLQRYGLPTLGCTLIHYSQRPEWMCGYDASANLFWFSVRPQELSAFDIPTARKR
jgi:hypothetical protein